MHKSLDDYKGIIDDSVLSNLYSKATKLSKKHIVNINSTYQGGGVAEILNNLVILMNDAGVFTGWRILHGAPDFFAVTKKFHNALQGDYIHFTKMKCQLYEETNRNFARFTHINHDCVIVHDPQPLSMIKFYRKRQPWIWRCHIDITNQNVQLWDYLKMFLLHYDLMIVSHEKYQKSDVPIPQRIIHPSIDPLSVKNIRLSQTVENKYINKFGIPTDKPFIVQISRFDKWKDPEGVLKVFEKVKHEVDCYLILCGSMASDDPEGMQIYNKIQQKVKGLKDVILFTVENNILVNILQSKAAVVLQKSLREGFALTVSEALWKGTPVVASDVGGIPLQIIDGENGFLVDPYDIDGCAKKVIEILKNEELRISMGKNGKEHVRKNFLITRELMDHLDMLIDVLL